MRAASSGISPLPRRADRRRAFQRQGVRDGPGSKHAQAPVGGRPLETASLTGRQAPRRHERHVGGAHSPEERPIESPQGLAVHLYAPELRKRVGSLLQACVRGSAGCGEQDGCECGSQRVAPASGCGSPHGNWISASALPFGNRWNEGLPSLDSGSGLPTPAGAPKRMLPVFTSAEPRSMNAS